MVGITNPDPDLQRKGRVVAAILLAMVVSIFTLAAFNLVQGQTQYNLSNAVALLLTAGFYLLNRLGYVTIAGLFTVTFITVSALLLLGEDATLNTTYVVMCIPILISSFLFAPWSGFIIAAPLIVGTLTITGVAPGDYPALLAIVVVATIAYTFSDSLNKAYGRTRHQALHDPLTGLPNRALFVDRLHQSVNRKGREPGLSAVLFMDLDGFKVINDSLGHDVGDELLIGVAGRLESSLRPGDTAARLGGDEFTVLLEGISGAGDAVNVAERIAEGLRAPFELGGQRIFATTSIGIALYSSPESAADKLLRNADTAMYEAKKAGKAGYRIFNPGMYAKALGRLELEQELRRAIEREEFEVRYHPKISLNGGGIVGMEALVRWEHPERGMLGPEEFIPLAEEAALINPLGLWVLEEACRQARAWQKRFPDQAANLTVGVNLSARQFMQPDLIEHLSKILLETGLSPGSLQLEIAESVVHEDAEHADGVLRRLESLGVRLSIDDFGKGYSPLTSLRRFPLDELKIDRSFVAGLGEDAKDTALVRLMVELAHTIGVRAVGEGVETDDQLARLKEMGCDMVQGFYFWEPMTGEEATALLARDPHPG